MSEPELEKPPAGTDGSDGTPFERTAYRTVYRCDSKSASDGRLRLVYDGELRARVLEKAADQVSQEPQTLSLWAYRLAQHVRVGTFGFAVVVERLVEAAVRGGAKESWATSVVYRAISDSMITDAPPMPLTVLRGGVH